MAQVTGEILGIVVTSDEVIVPVGTTIQLEALGLNTDRQTLDLTDAVDWSSSAPSIAAVSNEMSEEGVLRGMSAGTSVILADFDGVQSAPSLASPSPRPIWCAWRWRKSWSPSRRESRSSSDATFSDGSISMHPARSVGSWGWHGRSVRRMRVLEGISLGSTTVRVEWDGCHPTLFLWRWWMKSRPAVTLLRLGQQLHRGYVFDVVVNIRNDSFGAGIRNLDWIKLVEQGL